MCYWVNEDKPHNAAKVHSPNCVYPRQYGKKNPKNGKWYGPYESKALALAKARDTGRADVSDCQVCNP